MPRPTVWRRVAYSLHSQPEYWHECDDAPFSYDLARSLIHKNPAHIFANERTADRTYLVHQPAKRVPR